MKSYNLKGQKSSCIAMIASSPNQARLMQVRPMYKFAQYPGSPNLFYYLT